VEDGVVVEDAISAVEETEDSLREDRPREGDIPGPVPAIVLDLSLALPDARLADPEAETSGLTKD